MGIVYKKETAFTTAPSGVVAQIKPAAKKYKAVGTTTVTKKSGAEVSTEQVVKEILSINEMAVVGYSVGLTHNLGNYESAKVKVSLRMPCSPNYEAVTEAFGEVREWADNRLKEIKQELKG